MLNLVLQYILYVRSEYVWQEMFWQTSFSLFFFHFIFFSQSILDVKKAIFHSRETNSRQYLQKWDILQYWLVSSTYILDTSNSSSISFWITNFDSSSRSNWNGIWTDNGPSINNVGPFSRIYDPPPSPCRLRLLYRLM